MEEVALSARKKFLPQYVGAALRGCPGRPHRVAPTIYEARTTSTGALQMQERKQTPVPGEPGQKPGDESGPRQPEVKRPDSRELLERMRRVDPDTARRYRQRSGE